MTKNLLSDKNLILCVNPILENSLSIIRDKDTTPELFRSAVKRIAYFLIFTATKNIPTVSTKIETPLEEVLVRNIPSDIKIILAPILRAGLGFLDAALELLPQAIVNHIGMYRDEKTLEPVWYYNKLPNTFSQPQKDYVYILDPMLATGHSMASAIKLFIDSGMSEENIVAVTLISAPEGIINLRKHYGNVKIITASVDEKLNRYGYILPGLGDAGDRLFNTFS